MKWVVIVLWFAMTRAWQLRTSAWPRLFAVEMSSTDARKDSKLAILPETTQVSQVSRVLGEIHRAENIVKIDPLIQELKLLATRSSFDAFDASITALPTALARWMPEMNEWSIADSVWSLGKLQSRHGEAPLFMPDQLNNMALTAVARLLELYHSLPSEDKLSIIPDLPTVTSENHVTQVASKRLHALSRNVAMTMLGLAKLNVASSSGFNSAGSDNVPGLRSSRRNASSFSSSWSAAARASRASSVVLAGPLETPELRKELAHLMMAALPGFMEPTSQVSQSFRLHFVPLPMYHKSQITNRPFICHFFFDIIRRDHFTNRTT